MIPAQVADNQPEPVEESDDEAVPELEDEEYEIDYIVDSRWVTYQGSAVFEYYIHWKDYPEEDRSWTNGDQLEDDDPPVLDFYKKYPRKPRRNQKTIFSLMGRGNKTSSAKLTPKASSKNVTKLKPSSTKTSSTKTSSTKSVSKSTVSETAPRGPPPKKKPAISYASDSSEKENRRVLSRSPSPETEDEFIALDDDDSEDPSFESDPEEPEAETMSEDESDVVDDGEHKEAQASADDPEPARKAKNGGWGVKVKGPKKAAVKL